MIHRTKHFDLGRDKYRMKDDADALRQSATVDQLLHRYFSATPQNRWEIQILADEVGMGKTFVALATAYSVLQAMKSKTAPDSLRGCYKKVLIVTPHNSALFKKWNREVGEFVKRCVHDDHRSQAEKWFCSQPVERLDELVCTLRQRGSTPRIVVTQMGVFGRTRLEHLAVKQRQLLATIFRHWGNRFNNEKRKRLLKGASDTKGWPVNPDALLDFSDREWHDELWFDNEEMLDAVKKLDRKFHSIDKLHDTCEMIAAPFVRGRDELFGTVEKQLTSIYRELMTFILNKSLPLVVVDEAHNWKNGPRRNANGFNGFTDLIGCRTRRALLLTATPFQLRPDEMLEILKLADYMKPERKIADSLERTQRLTNHRESVVRPVLDRASKASRRFTHAWSKLPTEITTEVIQQAWDSPQLDSARSALMAEAEKPGIADRIVLEQIISSATEKLHSHLGQLVRDGLRLFVYNSDLSIELGRIAIRHRRHAGHRHFRVGNEYALPAIDSVKRPDKHLLHASVGVDVKGEGELPHYLLMRCVSESKGGKGKSSLGSALTGCYSTLLGSAEGKKVNRELEKSGIGKAYLELLMNMVGEEHDPRHPKVSEVVDAALENWKAGEKTLVFCFRTNNAKRLKDIIDLRIRAELENRREKCLGSRDGLRSLRSRMTGKDRDLIVLGLDRVLWSIIWVEELRTQILPPLEPRDLELSDEELKELVKIGIMHGIDVSAERVDRVFLNRATEHIIANRLLKTRTCIGESRCVLKELGRGDWIALPYGIERSDSSEEDHAHFDDRGVHSTYNEIVDAVPEERMRDQTAQEVVDRRERARNSIFNVYADGPSLWLGENPKEVFRQCDSQLSASTLTKLHELVLSLTCGSSSSEGDQRFDWESRLLLFQALRRAVYRDSILLRLLPDKQELDEGSWGELLVRSFHEPLPNQSESLLDRVTVFVEDISSASGSLTKEGDARNELYDATKLRGSQTVALVDGKTDPAKRTRAFSGFNSPLEPEILICTSVGQEGIDLHRHCRHVVHFDLAWNPAVLEQRTGRTDRIGSKTFRERELATNGDKPHLEIGVPYLAGTYDERMYEELRLRAQTFEVLTGGDLAADAEGNEDQNDTEGSEGGLHFVPLPESMINDMRVSLHVWEVEQAKEFI